MVNGQKQKQQLKTPTVYAHQLVPAFSNNGDGDFAHTVKITEPMVTGYHGPKRGGKTASLSFAACMAMAAGMKAYLNYPVKLWLKMPDGQKVLMESEILTLAKFIELLDSMEYVFIGIDEYQWWASAYTYNAQLNKYLDRFLQQVAHCDVVFHYTAKSRGWVDTITRFETDLSIHCTDAYYANPTEFKKGEKLNWSIQDRSGMWTGKMYEEYPIEHKRSLYFHPLKGCYDDKQRLDPWEAMGGLKVEMDKIIVDRRSGGDGRKSKLPPHNILKNQVLALFQSKPEWRPHEFWGSLGIENPHDQGDVVERLPDWGIKTKITSGRRSYIVSDL